MKSNLSVDKDLSPITTKQSKWEKANDKLSYGLWTDQAKKWKLMLWKLPGEQLN